MPQNLKAIAVPFRFDETGFPSPAFNEEVLRDMMRTVLLTQAGERVMRPTYGSYTNALLFENMNSLGQALAARVEFEIRRALDEHEPRVEVLGVELAFDSKSGEVTANISWRSASNNVQETTVPLGVIDGN